jgi:hypothetical protein
MNTHRLILFGFVIASCAGCYRIRYINNAPAEGTPASEQWHHNVIDGLWEVSQPINVSQICPQGFAEVKNEMTFLNWLASTGVQAAVDVPLSVATGQTDPATGAWIPGYSIPFTIWSPQTVSVTCAARTSAAETSPRHAAE